MWWNWGTDTAWPAGAAKMPMGANVAAVNAERKCILVMIWSSGVMEGEGTGYARGIYTEHDFPQQRSIDLVG